MADMQNTASGFLSSMQRSVAEANRREKVRAQNSKYLWFFYMPQAAGPDGKRHAVIRFLRAWENGVVMRKHEKWGSIEVACNRDIGKDCPMCDLGEAALAAQEIKTDDWYCWPVWDYLANNGDGAVRLFAYKINTASPVPVLLSMIEEEEALAKEEGRVANTDLQAADLILVQHGESPKRTFTARLKSPRPATFPMPPAITDTQLRESFVNRFNHEDDESGSGAANILPEDDDADVTSQVKAATTRRKR